MRRNVTQTARTIMLDIIEIVSMLLFLAVGLLWAAVLAGSL
jgi:hypothetical protein